VNVGYRLNYSSLNLFSDFETELNCPDVFALNFPVNKVGAITKPSRTLFPLDNIVHAVAGLRVDLVESVIRAHDLVWLLGYRLATHLSRISHTALYPYGVQ
jgi:hypothetical protein